jgi:hypothetical protein
VILPGNTSEGQELSVISSGFSWPKPVDPSMDNTKSFVLLRTPKGWLQPEIEYVAMSSITFQVAAYENPDMYTTFAFLPTWIRQRLFQNLMMTKWNLLRCDLTNNRVGLTLHVPMTVTFT